MLDGFVEEDEGRAIEFLTLQFESAEELSRFPDSHVAAGLEYLTHSLEGDHVRALESPRVDLEVRLRGLASVACVFERYLAHKCRSYIGHNDDGSQSREPLDLPCYMWWDSFALWPGRHNPETASFATVLAEVMKCALITDSFSCQESAVQGLDLYGGTYFVEDAIAMLSQQLRAWEEDHPVRDYAAEALDGLILCR